MTTMSGPGRLYHGDTLLAEGACVLVISAALYPGHYQMTHGTLYADLSPTNDLPTLPAHALLDLVDQVQQLHVDMRLDPLLPHAIHLIARIPRDQDPAD